MKNILRNRFILTIFLGIVINLMCLSFSFAYLIHTDTNKVGVYGGHEEITDYSIDKLDYDGKLKDALLGNRVAIKKGNTAEDTVGIMGVGLPFCGAGTQTHFYNPATRTGLVFNAYFCAGSYYEEARKTKSWEKLGHALHLLQDMAVPSHVHNAIHVPHYLGGIGYEWWVARNWDSEMKHYLDWVYQDSNNRRPFMGGDMGGFMRAMSEQTYFGGYDYDWWFPREGMHIVDDYESEHTAKVVIPQAINLGGGLFKRFWLDLGGPSSGPSSPGGGHPDDNFDVSSRIVELQELDSSGILWKDIYKRVGIKKGLIGFFLSEDVSNSYQKALSSATEEEFTRNLEDLGTKLNRASAVSKYTLEETYFGSPDIALLSNAFSDDTANLMLKQLQEPIREVTESFDPNIVNTQLILVIPSGGLYGLANSDFLKSSLSEYVKQGGTLIVFDQMHGYEYSILPTPDGNPITAYGWEEDQNCFTNAVSINVWHQIFSGLSRSTPTVNVDGYFTGYPAGATVLMSRTANGQPAMLMYDYGLGKVIATTMYSDWAYTHGQASPEETALVRDMITWAKKPDQLPEIKPGEIASFMMSVKNSTDTDAVSIRLLVYTPDRKFLLEELPAYIAVPAWQSAEVGAYFWSKTDTPLGIYHVDYVLLDAQGNIIQPQAETDSGRFIISNPPQLENTNKDIWLTITSPDQQVFYGEPFVYTFHIFNNTIEARSLKIKTLLPHTNRTHEWNITAAANGETTLTGSDLFLDTRWMYETLRAYLYDESGTQIGSYMLSFKGLYPSVSVTSKTDKTLYAKGETVNLAVTLQNKQSSAFTAQLQVKVTDPANNLVFSQTLNVNLSANGTSTQNMSFPLSASAQGGVYTVSAEVCDPSQKKIGAAYVSFELPLGQISVTPTLPSAFGTGTNTIFFSLSNIGKLNINSGVLNLNLKDPDGVSVYTNSQPFALAAGQSIILNFSVTLPTLKFGDYTLTYTVSDETQAGRSISSTISNSASIALSFDKSSYRVRDIMSLMSTLTNTGKFNLAPSAGSGLTVMVSVPDAAFSDAKTISLSANSNAQTLNYYVALPATISVGQHVATVTLTLPGGSSTTKSFTFSVPQSSLTASLSQASYTAGDVISPIVANNGGVDTIVQYTLQLYDSRSSSIASSNSSSTIPAGSSILLGLSIPSGSADGNYNLVMTYTDQNINNTQTAKFPLTISGTKADLAVQTDKQVYLSTESITGLSTLTNIGTSLQSGNLHLQVTTGGNQQQKTWSSQYDFQQGTRLGIDTFSIPDSITLVSYPDSFTASYLNTDRWNPVASAAGGTAPTVVNGRLYIVMPDGGWKPSYVDTKVPITGDFDAQVDYQVDSTNYYTDDNHHAGLAVWQNNGFYLWVDMWGSMIYGTYDYPYQYNNAGGASFTSKLRIRRVGSTYYSYYWNGSAWVNFLTRSNRPVDPTYIRLYVSGAAGKVKTYFDNFTVTTKTYPPSGTINLKYDSSRSEVWDKLSFTADTPTGTSIKFRTRTSDTQSGLSSATWSSYITASGSPITSPKNRWIEIETTLATTDTNVTPVLRDITVTQGHKAGDILWQSDTPVDLAQGVNSTLNKVIGALNTSGKLYLQGTLTASSGQTIATAEYPFYLVAGNTVLLFNTDKKIYRPGEMVTITGQVQNLASVTASALNLLLAINGQNIYTSTVDLPANGSYPFTVRTTAGTEGTYSVAGTVTQNNSTLVSAADQYEVASPAVTAIISVPDVVGNETFTSTVEIKNTGKAPAIVNLQASSDGQTQTISLSASETKLIQYTNQITANTTFVYTFTGDLNQTVTKTVSYGLSATLQINAQPVYPEGTIPIPVTLTNTGPLDENLTETFTLQPSSQTLTKTYFVPKAGSTTDTLYFNVTEGSYQLTASSQLPTTSGQASLSVIKENNIQMSMTAGAQSNYIVPVIINLTNLGYNSIDGSTQLSVIDGQGATVWNTLQDTSLPYAVSPSPLNLNFSVNTAAIQPGSYTLKGVFLNNSGQQLAVQSLPLSVQGAVIQITQLPPYQTFSPGQQGTFTFMIKNTGNREGAYELNFKAYDLIDSTQKDWLKAGEEKPVSFSFVLPTDLEEKDYFADYVLKTGDSPDSTASPVNPGTVPYKGQIKYHLSGISIGVDASLDKQTYRDGDTAHLTLIITQQTAGSAGNFFARVNYAGYESQQSFTLGQGQALTLQFDVPLTQITGEKLFYGIYQESGRSIHLNSLYIYKADDTLAVMTDKQVYNPEETVAVTVSSATGATGTMTLTGPDGYTETFDFTGTVIKTFVLSSTMTAGTYTVSATLTQGDSPLTASHPFDVAGIQVKVKQATLDKPKYVSSDTMNLTLLVESNVTIPATLKVWIVDPEKNYTQTGEKGIDLSSSENVLVTLNSSLITVLSGIHCIVYGIYSGDLLLVSGSVAFDVGDVVLSSLSTDKTDYSTGSEPVIAKAVMYGTVDADLELQIDGTTVKTLPVSLNGFTTMNIELQNVKPGTHGLKGILTASGLKSAKDASFTYGSSLPDLTAAISSQPSTISQDNTMSITTTVTNQGRTSSTETAVSLYDGETFIETKPVTALNQGESKEVTFVWNVLGKAGDHTLKAVVDPDDNVLEFNEYNNTATLQVTIPDITFTMTTDKDVYNIRDKANITSIVTNLASQKTLDSLILDTKVTDSSGAAAFTIQQIFSPIQPMNSVSLDTAWDTAGLTGGDYTVTQTVMSDSQSLTQKSKLVTLNNAVDFGITVDSSYQKVSQGGKATYIAHLTPLYGFNSMVELSIVGLPTGTSVVFSPAALVPPGDSTTVVITTEGTPPGSYGLTLVAQGGERKHEIALTLDVTGFALEVNPLTQVIKQLDAATFDLKLVSMNNYSDDVKLSFKEVAKGLRAVLGSTDASVPGEATLTIQTSQYTKPGIYTLTAVAKDDVIEKRADITLTVEANPDIAVGVITTPGPGPQNPALVSLFTKELNLIREFTAFDTKYGANAVMGDINADGYDEIIVAPGPDPRADAKIRIFRRDGTLMNEFKIFDAKYGATLATGDIDGDWKDEIVVGMGPDPKNPSRIKVLKYDSGRLLETGIDFIVFDNLKYGVNITLGDIDGDGLPEIIAGAGPDPKNPSRIKVFKIDASAGIGNWKIGSVILERVVDGNLYGVKVASGNMTGDSTNEIIVGPGPDPKNDATVKILDSDGTFAGEFSAYDDKHPYGVNVCSADFNDTGVTEIITGLGPGLQNQALLRIFNADRLLLNERLVYNDLGYGVRISKGRTGER